MNVLKTGLSWRDFELLNLAYAVSKKLGTPAVIPWVLLFKIFDEHVSINTGNVLVYLSKIKLIKKVNETAELVRLSGYDRSLLFGKDEFEFDFSPNTAGIIAQRWEQNNGRIFDYTTCSQIPANELVETDDLHHGRGGGTGPTRSGEPILRSIDLEQIVVDHKEAQNLRGEALLAHISRWVIQRHCDNGIKASQVQMAMKRIGILCALHDSDQAERWFLSTKGNQTAESSIACVSFTKRDKSKIARGMVSR
ncbi:MAG: hypothetical protein ABIH67_00855 [Candidatus Uhrbacteria bacterium]